MKKIITLMAILIGSHVLADENLWQKNELIKVKLPEDMSWYTQVDDAVLKHCTEEELSTKISGTLPFDMSEETDLYMFKNIFEASCKSGFKFKAIMNYSFIQEMGKVVTLKVIENK